MIRPTLLPEKLHRVDKRHMSNISLINPANPIFISTTNMAAFASYVSRVFGKFLLLPVPQIKLNLPFFLKVVT